MKSQSLVGERTVYQKVLKEGGILKMSITEEILTGVKISWRFPKTGKKKGSDCREKSKKLKEKEL